MSVLTRLRSAAGVFARSSVRRAARRTLDRTADCRETQAAVLRELLALNADSEFSRHHGLQSAEDVHALRAALPVSDYELVRPYVERVQDGDHRALLGSRNELLMFSLTSGTTNDSKAIPITRRFLDDYRRGWQTWGIHMLDDHFPQNRKNIVQLTSDYDQYRTVGGTPCGNISGLVCAMQKKVVRMMYTLPVAMMKIADPDAKYYTSLRVALNDRDVGMFTTANPSTLVRLAQLAEAEQEHLVRDLFDGTLSEKYDVPITVRRALGSAISKRRRGRARELERAIARDGVLRPFNAWPQLELLAVWTGGSCGYYLERVREYYGDLPIRDHGLHASEGRMTIPLADGTPSGVLDVTSHFFEFIPEEEFESENPTVLLAHELERDRDYYILLTTSSGLYRYDIHDVVRCTGFRGTTPTLAFQHKGAHVSSITGEKISETQVLEAVTVGMNGDRPSLGEFAFAPVWGDPPGYNLLVETVAEIPPEGMAALADRVDAKLQSINVEYGEKRTTGRLAPLEPVPLAPGTWQRVARTKLEARGGSSEQYKHSCLVPDLDFANHVLALQTAPAAASTTTPAPLPPHTPSPTPARTRQRVTD